MTPGAAARKFERKAVTLQRESVRAVEKTAALGVEYGQKASQGGFSLQELARAGHPYSVRRPQAAYNAALINYHNGEFFRGFRQTPVLSFGGGLKSGVVNSSDVAGYLMGRDRPRSRMRRRPVDDLVTEQLRPDFAAIQRIAVRRSVKA